MYQKRQVTFLTEQQCSLTMETVNSEKISSSSLRYEILPQV